MKKIMPIAVAIAGLLGVQPVHAEEAKKKTSAPSESEIRKDPKGLTGISPAKEAIADGRKAFARKDYGTALSHFERARSKETDKALAGYLIAQTKLRLADLQGAIEAAKAARATNPQAPLAAKLLFLEAELLEQKANSEKAKDKDSLRGALVTGWEAARDAWTAYAVYLRVNTTLPDHKATAEDRRAKIADRQQRAKVYGEVRSRIKANEKNRAAKAKKKK